MKIFYYILGGGLLLAMLICLFLALIAYRNSVNAELSALATELSSLGVFMDETDEEAALRKTNSKAELKEIKQMVEYWMTFFKVTLAAGFTFGISGLVVLIITWKRSKKSKLATTQDVDLE